jgi:hypothetical protein
LKKEEQEGRERQGIERIEVIKEMKLMEGMGEVGRWRDIGGE